LNEYSFYFAVIDNLNKKERITSNRRKQIQKAALSVFSAGGYGKSTMADVARKANVSVGTLYNYYHNKRDLLISLVKTLLISEGLVSRLGKMEGQSSRDFMISLLEERLEFGFGNGQTMLFLFFEIQRDAKLRRQYVRQVVTPLLSKLEDYIRSQVTGGAFRSVDEKIIARTMAGAIIGSVILYSLEQRDSPFKKANLKTIAAEIGSLYISGLERK